MSKRTKRPETIIEAVESLMAKLSPENTEKIRSMARQDIGELHFSLGLYIRNAFGLWSGTNALLRACGNVHEDDASTVILKALWDALHPGPAQPPNEDNGAKGFAA